MRVRLAAGVCVVVLLALLAGTGEAVRRSRLPAELVPVATVDELRGTRAISVPDGRAWVGISSLRVMQNEPVILYALVQSTPEPHTAWGISALGPFRVETRLNYLAEMVRSMPRVSDSTRLYMHTLSFDEQGVEEVKVVLGEAVVAHAIVTVTRDRLPPFLRLPPFETKRRWNCSPPCVWNERSRARVRVDGFRAFDVPAHFLPRPFDRPSLELAVEDDVIIIRSKRSDLVLKGRLPDAPHGFAARWWRNGRPIDGEYALGRELERPRHEEVRELRLHLHFKRDRFGVEQGDRIGIQVLALDGDLPRVTNRVDFIAP